MATLLTINEFAKTLEGKTLIQSGRPFCYGGFLYQGFNGAPIDVHEKQLTNQEIDALHDVDDSISRILQIRNQRLGSKRDRKYREYTKRRQELRTELGTIEDRIERRDRMKLPRSRADFEDLKELDKRMERLSMLADAEKDAAGGITEKDDPVERFMRGESTAEVQPEEAAEEVEEPESIEATAEDILRRAKEAAGACEHCGKVQPAESEARADRWMRGHLIHCKARKAKEAVAS